MTSILDEILDEAGVASDNVLDSVLGDGTREDEYRFGLRDVSAGTYNPSIDPLRPYFRDAFRMMQISNCIGRPEYAAQLGIDLSAIMEAAYPVSPTTTERLWESFLAPMEVTEAESYEQRSGLLLPTSTERDMERVQAGAMSFEEFRQRHDPTTPANISRITDIVTWPLQLNLMLVNTAYEGARPHRRVGDRGSVLDRLQIMWGGADWEPLQPDIQAVMWETMPVNVMTAKPLINIVLGRMLMEAGRPELAGQVMANTLEVEDVLSGRPYGERMPELEAMMHPVEHVAREFVTETAFDPLLWIPGAGGFLAKTPRAQAVAEVERMVNLLEGGRVNPVSGEVIAAAQGRAMGGRIGMPTVGEYIGWGANRANAHVRNVLDPFGPIRRIALRRSRYYGAESVLDLQQMNEWDEMIELIAREGGISVEEVSRGATQAIEEIFASERFGLRNRSGGSAGRRILTMPDEERRLLEAQRRITEPFAGRPEAPPVRAGEVPVRPKREQFRLFGEAPERVVGAGEEARIMGMSEAGPYTTGYLRPRGASRGFVPGVTEPPIEAGVKYTTTQRPYMRGLWRVKSQETEMRAILEAMEINPNSFQLTDDILKELEHLDFTAWEIRDALISPRTGVSGVRSSTAQFALFGTAEERTAIIEQVMKVQAERLRLGRISAVPEIAAYEAMPMSQLERTLEVANNAFINEQVNVLNGIRAFQRAVRTQTGVTPPVYRATESIIREAIPGLREADPETIRRMANLIYEGSWDSLNVGPRAPMARERAAGILMEPLSGHLGYIKHIPSDVMLEAYSEALRRSGWTIGEGRFLRKPGVQTISHQRIVNELGNAIRHESTRSRGWRFSIAEGNRFSAEGKVWIKPATKPGELPVPVILAEGQTPGANWVRVDKMFNDNLPLLIGQRRLAASRMVEGTNYMNEVMELHGTYSPLRRPEGMTSLYDLQGMSDRVTGKPMRMWTDTFGHLSPEIQDRIMHTYFPDIWQTGDSARAILRWNKIAKGDTFIREMIPIERIFWSGLRSMNRYWRPKMLNAFSGYHLRNHYDDCVRLATWFDNWNPTRMSEAYCTLHHGQIPIYVREYIGKIKGITAAEVTLDDVLYFARGENAIGGGFYHDEVGRSLIGGVSGEVGTPTRWTTGTTAVERFKKAGLTGVGEGWVHSPANPFSTNFMADQLGREFGREAEDIRRLSGFYAGMLEPAMDGDMAKLGQKLRNVMIDYLDLDPITRVAREFMPFITFQRHAIPLNIRSLFERSGRVSLRLRAYDKMDAYFDEAYDREDEPPPGWSGGRAYKVGKDYWFVPRNFDSVFDFEEIGGTFSRFVNGDRVAGGQLMSEYLGPGTVPFEIAFNWDSYRGQPIYDRWEGNDVPKFLTDLGLSERGMKNLWYGINSVWRAARDVEGVWKIATGEREFDPTLAFRRITGTPIFQAEPGQTVHYLLRDNQTQLERIGAENTYGNWSFYGIEPDRYDRAAELFGERIVTHLLVEEYLQRDPWEDEERPFLVDIREYGEMSRLSQNTMLERLQRDVAGCFSLQDTYDADVRDGRVRAGDEPFTVAELRFLENLNQSIILTQIALAMMAAEEGEITEESLRGRVERRYAEMAK